MKLEVGARVTPKVELVRQLGVGGMGQLWVAHHEGLGTEVAVKFLLGAHAENDALRARFAQEAAAASQVKSAHVVKIYDYGVTDSNVPFIVMELLEGDDLAARIRTEVKLAPSFVMAVTAQLCKALERAHERGVVHRDIKPENIFLGSEGGEVFVKLLDFGIAKTELLTKQTISSRRSTFAGETLGTPYYMSPEQFRSAKEIDSRTDLYSVGVVVYEALTGELPFTADTVAALAIVVNEGLAKKPTEVDPALPPALDAWFAKACARKPDDRFQTARELVTELRVALGEKRPSDRPSAVSLSPSSVVLGARDASATSGEGLGLRDTAFATSRGTVAARPSRGLYYALGAVVVLGLAGGAVALGMRASPAAAPKATASADPTVAASVTSPLAAPSATVAVASASVAPSASVATPSGAITGASGVVATSSARHVGPSASTARVDVAKPAASTGAEGGTHGDIW